MKHAGGQVGGGRDRTRAREERGGGAAWYGERHHMRAHGSGLRACEAYGRPVVEEVRGAAEGACIFLISDGLYWKPAKRN